MAFFMLIVMNVAVMFSLYLILFVAGKFFGIYIDQRSMGGLFVISLFFGFGGSFVSLLLSKFMAVRSMGVEVIKTPKNDVEIWLLKTVENLSSKAGIKMPDVGVFNGVPNAFATGWNKNNSLVAISTGLLEVMQTKEIEGVIAHEISHIKNGDMVTMTLMQGVLNTFVIFISRILASVFSRNKDGSTNQGIYFLVSILLEMVFSLFATMILMWFSRYREYKADEGAVNLDGAEGIYYALARLGQVPAKELSLQNSYKSFGFVGFLGSFFASHPPIEKRLKHIKEYVKS